MAQHATKRSPFVGLRRLYERTEAVCAECGYRDDGGWDAVSRSAGSVEFRHACPSCGAVSVRELRYG